MTISTDATQRQMRGAVGSMALCVAMLIASEFMPVSLLTPIATDLQATQGLSGQAISVSGLFAVLSSLFIAPLAGRFDTRHVLLSMTLLMLLSLVMIALAPSFALLMAARALLGLSIGGFWSLATATIIRLVPAERVVQALGTIYMGTARHAAAREHSGRSPVRPAQAPPRRPRHALDHAHLRRCIRR